jgi:translocator protein
MKSFQKDLKNTCWSLSKDKTVNLLPNISHLPLNLFLMKNWVKLPVSLAACLSAGAIGSLFIDSESEWFINLKKPEYYPPDWTFAIVWIFLYILIAFAVYNVWAKGWKSRRSKFALSLFLVQLVLNALWPIVFFGLQSILGGFILLIVLLAVVVITTVSFYPISRTGFWLMIPYLLWIIFATHLNSNILWLNS